MSCSKIFLRDLPELTYEIIKYFQNDYSTLHSCILINRLWCRLAIPLLWENPFSIPSKNYKMIEIYLHNLNDDFKTKLIEYKFINNSLSSKNIMFNYLKFLKYLNIYKFILSVDKWFISAKPEIMTDDFEQNFRGLVHISLFKIFIENEVNLRTLEIEICTYRYNYKPYLNNTLELILQNQNFIHNIGNLKLYINDHKVNAVINNHVSQIIYLHQNLKKILIYDNYESLYQSLLLSKDYNCSNTLNTIIFYYVEFKLINNLDEVFEQLNVLESVHIVECFFLNSNFIQQIINLTKPFKLKSLILNEPSQIETLQQLLQKFGNYLENFGGYEICLKHDISQLLKYRDNINFLYFFGCESEISIYRMINLIKNIKQSLNYLIINIWDSTICNSIILKNLGQILPSKLDYMSLNFVIKESDFRVFLENSQYIFINKLLINPKNGSDDILHYIKEYIMKEKRVKYLAIKDNKNDKELFDLKDEVREFELHNIIVRRYSDLVIYLDDFIWNID